MAAFSYNQLQPFLLPSPSLPTNTTPQFYLPQPSSHGYGTELSPPENETSLAKKQSSESSTVLDKAESGEQVTQKINSKEKKRKKRNTPFFSSDQAKSKVERRGTKEKKKNEKEVLEKAPTGYIHVRARRGEATDSHSLAERVRREKISERMKMLQRLVPGCDEVIGKALVLDEIINYVQSLQNQVEFLSMKLASINPLSYQFENDLDPFMLIPECGGFTNHVSTLTSHSPSLFHDQAHKSMPFCDNVNLMWGGEDPDQKFVISPALSNNLCPFN